MRDIRISIILAIYTPEIFILRFLHGQHGSRTIVDRMHIYIYIYILYNDKTNPCSCVYVCKYTSGAKRNFKGLPRTRPEYVKTHKGRLVNIPTVLCLVREHSHYRFVA